MRTRYDIEAAIEALGWKLSDGPTRIPGGWKATIQRSTASVLATGSTDLGVLEDLLRSAQAKQEGR